MPQIALPAGTGMSGSHFCQVISWQWFPRGLPHTFHCPSLERLPSRAALTASSASGFPGENDATWVSSHRATEQLLWFRFAINKKNSESNILCQLGQQQIPECSGFSLLDKIDKPHPTPIQQRDKTLSKEIEHSCPDISEGRHRQGRAVLALPKDWHCHPSDLSKEHKTTTSSYTCLCTL